MCKTKTTQKSPIGSNATNPSDYPRRVLLVTTGLSPQVVTESLYALAVRNKQKFLPTEIHLITTKIGAERACSFLLGDQGWLPRFCHDYKISGIQFDLNFIRPLLGADGQPLDDIQTPVDNQLAADQITNCVRQLTADPDSAIHASIAGGRKSMGLFLGYALSFFGRPQDRLSHVLVSPPYESNPNFFYPTPKDYFIQNSRSGHQRINAAEAEVNLAEIKFVRLRNEIPAHVLENAAVFDSVVDIAQQVMKPAELIIDLEAQKIQASGKAIKASPVNLAFFAWLARNQKAGGSWVICPVEEVREREHADSFLNEYQRIKSNAANYMRTVKRLEGGMTRTFFSQTKSKLNRQLREKLPNESMRPYLIERRRDGNIWRHGFNVASENIHFEKINSL